MKRIGLILLILVLIIICFLTKPLIPNLCIDLSTEISVTTQPYSFNRVSAMVLYPCEG